MDKNYWIEKLKLQHHPDGGYFIENYRSKDFVEYLDGEMEKQHNAATSIYHLLESENHAFCHKLSADEIWYYHDGSPVTIFMIDPEGNFSVKICDPGEDEEMAVIIPKNTWFGPRVFEPKSYVLASCSLAPGFEFIDLQMADRNELIRIYPKLKDVILKYMMI